MIRIFKPYDKINVHPIRPEKFKCCSKKVETKSTIYDLCLRCMETFTMFKRIDKDTWAEIEGIPIVIWCSYRTKRRDMQTQETRYQCTMLNDKHYAMGKHVKDIIRRL